MHIQLTGTSDEVEAAIETLELAWDVRDVSRHPTGEAGQVQVTAKAIPSPTIVLCACGHTASQHDDAGCRDCGCVVVGATWRMDGEDGDVAAT